MCKLHKCQPLVFRRPPWSIADHIRPARTIPGYTRYILRNVRSTDHTFFFSCAGRFCPGQARPVSGSTNSGRRRARGGNTRVTRGGGEPKKYRKNQKGLPFQPPSLHLNYHLFAHFLPTFLLTFHHTNYHLFNHLKPSLRALSDPPRTPLSAPQNTPISNKTIYWKSQKFR